MGKMIYLAYPIDNAQQSTHFPEMRSDAQWLQNQFSNMDDVFVYDPGAAWRAANCRPDPRLAAINTMAVTQADIVVAVYPDGMYSTGVPMELGLASFKRIPCVVLGGPDNSWSLQSPYIAQVDSLGAAFNAAQTFLENAPDRAAAAPRSAKYVVDQDIPYGGQVEPERGYADDAGYDLFCAIDRPMTVGVGESVNVPSGVRIQWPQGVWGLMVGRSSTFHKKGLLVNTAVIDPGYRGPMFANLRNIGLSSYVIQPGERLAQIIPLPALAPQIPMEQVDELDETDRGHSGFGSSG